MFFADLRRCSCRSSLNSDFSHAQKKFSIIQPPLQYGGVLQNLRPGDSLGPADVCCFGKIMYPSVRSHNLAGLASAIKHRE